MWDWNSAAAAAHVRMASSQIRRPTDEPSLANVGCTAANSVLSAPSQEHLLALTTLSRRTEIVDFIRIDDDGGAAPFTVAGRHTACKFLQGGLLGRR